MLAFLADLRIWARVDVLRFRPRMEATPLIPRRPEGGLAHLDQRLLPSGVAARNTTKCDIEKLTANAAANEKSFAAKMSVNCDAKTKMVVATITPSTPDATKRR